MRHLQRKSALRWIAERVLVVTGAASFTMAFFLVLPLLQALNRPVTDSVELTQVDIVDEPPPPPPPVEEEPEEEPEPEEPPPQLEQETQRLDLDQLELALNPGFGGGPGYADFEVKLVGPGGDGEGVDKLFDLADLDQKPRVIYQPSPTLSDKVRKRAPGTVYVLFIVDPQGRVENPIVQRSSDPIFERPALNAVKQWKFEPGKRKGEPVRFRMRVPVTFPKG